MNTVKVNIDLSFNQLVDAVKQLSPEEKLMLNDVLWDESMKIPAEHQALVVGRIKKAKNNPDRLMDWDKASNLLK
ncbi:MAG: addiction module protein [Ginsengibacter sp.]